MKQELGKTGEDRAVEFLVSNGYTIVTRNYRFRRNEIDIIARKEETLVFVEVKAKSYASFGMPVESVSDAQIERILETADHYIHSIGWESDIRFDIIAILKAGDKFMLEHFEDAFH